MGLTGISFLGNARHPHQHLGCSAFPSFWRTQVSEELFILRMSSTDLGKVIPLLMVRFGDDFPTFASWANAGEIVHCDRSVSVMH